MRNSLPLPHSAFWKPRDSCCIWIILHSRLPNTGRVHEAAITSVDEERRFVSVEWFENGETKGKEVSTINVMGSI